MIAYDRDIITEKLTNLNALQLQKDNNKPIRMPGQYLPAIRLFLAIMVFVVIVLTLAK